VTVKATARSGPVRTTGRLAPGAKLPGEIELAAQYGVARLTVRRAIRELVAEERLVILRGRGTYVKQRDS
jgi:DNA-binding GntR family transcriptional regulator